MKHEIFSFIVDWRPRRKFRISLEALFMIDFPAAKNKFSFYLDRKGKRITIDINTNAKIFSKHLDVPMLNETTTIRSLALMFSQNVITLYIDCKDVLKEEMEFNLSQLYLDMEDPSVKLFRERKYPLYLDNTMENALDRSSCQKSSSKKKPNVRDNERKKHFDGRLKIILGSARVEIYEYCSFTESSSNPWDSILLNVMRHCLNLLFLEKVRAE